VRLNRALAASRHREGILSPQPLAFSLQPLASSLSSMILHRLLLRFLKHGDDPEFYLLQARDAIRWLEQSGVVLGAQTPRPGSWLWHGVFGAELVKRGCQVTSQTRRITFCPKSRAPRSVESTSIEMTFSSLGQYNLVICSNVLSTLPNRTAPRVGSPDARPGGQALLKLDQLALSLGWTRFRAVPLPGPGLDSGCSISWFRKPRKACRVREPLSDLHRAGAAENPTELNTQGAAAAPRYYTEFPFL